MADNLPPSCAVVTKSGSLNFLEPSGPVQACNGAALPLPSQLRFTGIALGDAVPGPYTLRHGLCQLHECIAVELAFYRLWRNECCWFVTSYMAVMGWAARPGDTFRSAAFHVLRGDRWWGWVVLVGEVGSVTGSSRGFDGNSGIWKFRWEYCSVRYVGT